MKTFFLNIYYSFCKVESALYHYGDTTAFSSNAMIGMMVSLQLGLSAYVGRNSVSSIGQNQSLTSLLN